MTRIALSLVAPLAMCMLGACKDGPAKSDSPGQTPAATPAAPANSAGAPAKGGPIDQPTQPGAAAGAPATKQPTVAAGEPASTGIAECDSYIKRLLDCNDYPQQGKDVVRASIEVWKKDSESGGDAAKAALDDCKKSMQQSDQSLKGMGC
jgi:hypothetical protein